MAVPIRDLEIADFSALVEQIFRFLLDEYGFSIALEEILYEGTRHAIVFQSSDLCVEVGLDYSEVYVDLSLCAERKKTLAFGLGRLVMLEYLKGHISEEEWRRSLAPHVNASLEYRARVIAELE
ncbi:MAG: hypothetical protein L0Y55_18305, partial [Anaerolineales bacterium]|nr:hypothetical protein [Anaerolineales bacterium]